MPTPAATARTRPRRRRGEPAPRRSRACRPHASPSVRRFARELGVDLGRSTGTGPKGRIPRRTCRRSSRASCAAAGARPRPRRRAAAGHLPEMPEVDFAKFGPVETKPLSRIKQLSGAAPAPQLGERSRMSPSTTRPTSPSSRPSARSWTKKPRKQGDRVTHARVPDQGLVAALRKFPRVQRLARPAKDALISRSYFHIGFAVDTPEGLVVPVIQDVDRKGVFELSQELGEVSKKARDGKLRPGRHAGRLLHDLAASAASAAPTSRRSSTRPRSRSSASSRSKMAPVWDGERVRAAADAAAVAVLRPPRDRRRAPRARFTGLSLPIVARRTSRRMVL